MDGSDEIRYRLSIDLEGGYLMTLCYSEVTERSIWEYELSHLRAENLYTSWAWGEYKRRRGLRVYRILVKETVGVGALGVLQLQVRRYPVGRVFIVQGSPQIKIGAEALLSEIVHGACAFVAGRIPRAPLVMNYYGAGNDRYIESLLQGGFRPVINNKMYSFFLIFEAVSARKSYRGIGGII